MFSSVIFFLADKAAKTRLKEFVKNRVLFFFHIVAKNRFRLVMFFLVEIIRILATQTNKNLQTIEKSQGQLEIRRFSDQTNRLGATYFSKKKSKERNKRKIFEKNEKFSKTFSKIFRIFPKLFVRFVLSKKFREIGGAETIRLV